jgi:hypothetical protein
VVERDTVISYWHNGSPVLKPDNLHNTRDRADECLEEEMYAWRYVDAFIIPGYYGFDGQYGTSSVSEAGENKRACIVDVAHEVAYSLHPQTRARGSELVAWHELGHLSDSDHAYHTRYRTDRGVVGATKCGPRRGI